MSAIPPSPERSAHGHYRSIVADPPPSQWSASKSGRTADAFGGATNQPQPTKEPITMRGHATARARGEPDLGQALMDAAEAIADMARRVQLNGPEPVYTSEKLGHALYKAAEGLALCGVQIDEVTAEVCRGHEHGLWLGGEDRDGPRPVVPFVIQPVSRDDAHIHVTSRNRSVVLHAVHPGGSTGLRLTGNEARVLANVLNATARRVEGRP
jgi:hypothetical protein